MAKKNEATNPVTGTDTHRDEEILTAEEQHDLAQERLDELARRKGAAVVTEMTPDHDTRDQDGEVEAVVEVTEIEVVEETESTALATIETALVPDEVIVPESAGDAKVAKTKPVLVIDPTAPWAGWANPDVLTTKTSKVSVVARENGLDLLGEEGDRVASIHARGMQQLGWHGKFPGEFVAKLSVELQAAVINERLHAVVDHDVALVMEGDEFTNLLPGWREVAGYREVCQTAFDTLQSVYGEIEVVDARQTQGQMSSRFLVRDSAFQQAVTPKRGDVLQLGFEVTHNYGLGINVALYVNRLICTNGMTAESQEYTWRTRSHGSVEHQLAWMVAGLGSVAGAYERIVSQSRAMAESPVTGDPHKALEEYARAMRWPSRAMGMLHEAFDEEPESTQWGILNAFTRVATRRFTGTQQRAFQQAAGNWTNNFDMVTARLPRPVALNAGAQILDE